METLTIGTRTYDETELTIIREFLIDLRARDETDLSEPSNDEDEMFDRENRIHSCTELFDYLKGE